MTLRVRAQLSPRKGAASSRRSRRALLFAQNEPRGAPNLRDGSDGGVLAATAIAQLTVNNDLRTRYAINLDTPVAEIKLRQRREKSAVVNSRRAEGCASSFR